MKEGDQRRVASLSVYSLAAAAAAAALTAATASAGTTGAFSAPPQQRQQLHNGGTVMNHGLSSFIPPPSPCTTDPTSRHACPAAAAGRRALGSSTAVVSGAGGPPVFTAGSRWVRRRDSAVPRVAGGVRQQQGLLLARGAGAADGPATGVSRPIQGRGGDGKEEGAMRKLDERDLRQRKFTKGMKQLGYRGGWKAVRGLIAEAGRVGLPLNVICLNAAMSVLARSGRWYEALDLLSMMRRGALLVDVDGGGGGSGADQGMGFREPRVEGEEASSSPMLVLPEPDTITFNAAITGGYGTGGGGGGMTTCGRGNKWKSAVELLDSMRREGLVPDGFSYSAAITACKNCGQWETALGLLDDMRMRGLGRDRHSLNAAIAACASAGRWKPAMEILEGMEMKGPSPDVFTYGAVIDALAHGGEVDLALRTLKRMRSDPSRYPAPNTVCHNAALMALMRDGRWREARGLLSEVVSATPATEGSVELDFLSYNTVIRACAAAGEAEEALKTREEMRAAGIPADAYTYEALSTACGLAGNWAAAEAVVREMVAGCSSSSSSSSSSSLSSTAAAAAAAAAQVPSTAAERGSAAAADAAAAMAAAAVGAGSGSSAAEEDEEEEDSWSQTLRHRQRRRRERLENGVPPSPRVFHGLMEAYSRAGEWERAQQCLDDMRQGSGWLPGDDGRERVGAGTGVKPDSTSVGWAIQACAAAGQWDRALATFSGAKSDGIEPGQLCFDAALLACAVGGQGARATSLLAEMATLESEHRLARLEEEENASPSLGANNQGVRTVPHLSEDDAAPRRSTDSYRLGMEACRRGGDTRGVMSTFVIMEEEGFEPDVACFNEALQACAEGGGRFERAAAFLEEMKEAGLCPDNVSYSAALLACESCHDQEGAAKTAFDLIQTISSSASESPDAGSNADADGGGESKPAGESADGGVGGPVAPLSPPSARDYLAALRACAGAGAGATGCAGSPSLALGLLADLKASAVAAVAAVTETGGPGSPPPCLLSEHYCAAMTACGRGGNAQEVLDLLSELREAGAGGVAASSGSPPLDGGGGQSSGTGDEEEEKEEAARSAEATQTAAAAGILPSLSPAIYAAAANALADVGEWEWCLVLLEELEQLDMEQDDEAMGAAATTAAALSPPPPAGVALASAADDNNGEEQEAPGDGRADAAAPETVLRVELDESGALAAPATASSEEEAMSAMEAAAAATAATYTAAVRACGEGGAGVQAVVGVLERMRWAGADPGEDTYAAAISAFRACGGAREGEEASGRGVLSAEEAARALVDHETGRDGRADWASPFLYRLFFVEGRRAAGIATDDAAEVAAAAVAAAAAAADSGSAPKRPARVNPGVEAVYMSCLTMCAAAGDGSLARDVLRWMKLEGFQAGEEAYMLAIEACCNPTVPQDSPAAPQQQSSFTTPPATSRQRLPLPPPAVTSGATSPEDLAGVRRKLFSEGEAPESEQLSAAAATSEVVTVNPPPPRDDGDDGVAAVVRSATAGTSVPGVEDPASSVDEDVERGRVTEKVPAAAAAAAESMNQQRPQPPLVEEEERKAERPELEWVVIPGGRLSPPEFDEDGNEKNIAPPGTMGGAAWATGGATAGAGGSVAVGFGGGDGAPFPLEGEVTTAAASRRDGDSGTTSPASARADVSRAGAVNVLSPLAAATPAAPAAAGGGRSSGQGRTPPVDPDAVVAAGSSSTPTAAAADEGGSSSMPGSGASSTDSKRSVNNNNNGGAGGGGADWERARAILDDMMAADHLPPPPEEAFRAVLGACDSAGRVGEALEIAQVMVGAGFRPSIALMARLMASHADELDRERREMEEAAAEPAEEWGETS
ncbi:unnamed protein product [Ectocarpus sp. 4 AP-2014]